ncbi:hypothetical protein Glove_221g43 [Diversispora epigaea]|uniref:Uncharacterized protein n=1 Tax=Diversispora epigaea TaxID=1348612 RepID=A0A397IN01_9GLOM|nr:hypothetical protein Glove_221g43 [Diversispora epigaea]
MVTFFNDDTHSSQPLLISCIKELEKNKESIKQKKGIDLNKKVEERNSKKITRCEKHFVNPIKSESLRKPKCLGEWALCTKNGTEVADMPKKYVLVQQEEGSPISYFGIEE